MEQVTTLRLIGFYLKIKVWRLALLQLQREWLASTFLPDSPFHVRIRCAVTAELFNISSSLLVPGRCFLLRPAEHTQATSREWQRADPRRDKTESECAESVK